GLSILIFSFSISTVVIITSFLMVFFFFFQAEDGIRDLIVTGVQTCALPIFRSTATRPSARTRPRISRPPPSPEGGGKVAPRRLRSEERRVGKECRSRVSPYH